ncbi:MAG: hypothetical protein HY535_06945 [Chloroflexi bacterium]|nr:hypothetical protein [Chloroflexota bacterium]
MANVRIDQNGIPKGPVYETLPPAAHRTNVTAVDSSDPAGTTGAIDAAGFQDCRFDIIITGTGFTSLEVAVLFWNSRQSKWFTGASRLFTTTGQHALSAEARGAIVYLKVVAFSGTSFTLNADYVLS